MHNSLQQEQINLILRAAAGHITPVEARNFFAEKVLSEQHSQSENVSCVLLSLSYRPKLLYFCLLGYQQICKDINLLKYSYLPPTQPLETEKWIIVRGKKSRKCAETIEVCHSSSLKAGSTVVIEALSDLLG